ncbi:hypothetical protein HYH03_010220 [Edaphochlamys debaryana]|uniref:Calcineurin-like phosphoesterase domain-containing protein n=1 Tax=Edaphochlamys debaryana TaxID=47281 RepID=A0A835Y5I0_9CHLO|nr:hypothetical protein HYH03_010220 [Edaphochlamys debaryana]|eukprot:KAG2491434.1 hypothetical protein HYH03_010220 [Edaphochlamys debaryana]
MRTLEHTHLGFYLVGFFFTACVLSSSAQSFLERNRLNRKWLVLYGVLCVFAYLYARPFIRVGLGSAKRGYINFSALYIVWLCSAVFYHLPSLESLGVDVKTDVSMLIVVFLSSLAALTALAALHTAAVWLRLLPRRAYLPDQTSGSPGAPGPVVGVGAGAALGPGPGHGSSAGAGAGSGLAVPPGAALGSGRPAGGAGAAGAAGGAGQGRLRDLWTLLLLNSAVIALACSTYHSFCGNGNVVIGQDTGAFRAAVCAKWLHPILTAEYPRFASVMLYGEGAAASRMDCATRLNGTGRPTANGSTANGSTANGSTANGSFITIDFPFDGRGVQAVPAGDVLSPLLCMWITLVALYLTNTLAGQLSALEVDGDSSSANGWAHRGSTSGTGGLGRAAGGGVIWAATSSARAAGPGASAFAAHAQAQPTARRPPVYKRSSSSGDRSAAAGAGTHGRTLEVKRPISKGYTGTRSTAGAAAAMASASVAAARRSLGSAAVPLTRLGLGRLAATTLASTGKLKRAASEYMQAAAASHPGLSALIGRVRDGVAALEPNHLAAELAEASGLPPDIARALTRGSSFASLSSACRTGAGGGGGGGGGAWGSLGGAPRGGGGGGGLDGLAGFSPPQSSASSVVGVPTAAAAAAASLAAAAEALQPPAAAPSAPRTPQFIGGGNSSGLAARGASAAAGGGGGGKAARMPAAGRGAAGTSLAAATVVAAAVSGLPAQPQFLPMVPWYSGTSADLFKMLFDLLVSVKLFLGRFDMRAMQAATPSSMADSFNDKPSEGDGFMYEHLDERDELWIDFMADTGDGGNSTYSVASALAAPGLAVDLEAGALPSEAAEALALVDGAKAGKPGRLVLPRATLLILGGDLAYPNPSRDTYRQRLFRPFEDAFPPPPHFHAGRLVVHKPDLPPVWGVHEAAFPGDLRGLSPRSSRHASSAALRRYGGPSAFAIPGNHDWFDGLETFTREIQHKGWLGGWLLPQEKSYFALRLPAGWWLFGFDLALVRDIDMQQYRYFANVVEQRMEPTDQVILVTHEPLWLLEWFWHGSFGANLRQLVRGHLRGRARLHLAGDLHFYMRHSWGAAGGEAGADPHQQAAGDPGDVGAGVEAGLRAHSGPDNSGPVGLGALAEEAARPGPERASSREGSGGMGLSMSAPRQMGNGGSSWRPPASGPPSIPSPTPPGGSGGCGYVSSGSFLGGSSGDESEAGPLGPSVPVRGPGPGPMAGTSPPQLRSAYLGSGSPPGALSGHPHSHAATAGAPAGPHFLAHPPPRLALEGDPSAGAGAAASSRRPAAAPCPGCQARAAWARHPMDPEHLVVAGGGGAFLHPTHVFAGARFRAPPDPAAEATAGLYAAVMQPCTCRIYDPVASAHVPWYGSGGVYGAMPHGGVTYGNGGTAGAGTADGTAGIIGYAALGPDGEYTCRSAYPGPETSLRLGRKNLHLFRLRNTRFDVIGGLLYFGLVVSVLPRCSLVGEVLEADTPGRALALLASAYLDTLGAIVGRSYLSAAALLFMFLGAYGLAAGGGAGVATGPIEGIWNWLGAPSSATKPSSPPSPGPAAASGPEAPAAAAAGAPGSRPHPGPGPVPVPVPVPCRPPLLPARLGGWGSQLALAAAHTLTHASCAIVLLLVLELGVETCIKYERLGADGPHSLYRWYRAYEEAHFPDPMGLRAGLERWSLGVYPGALQLAMAVYDVPELIAVSRTAMCAAGGSLEPINRLQAWAYYGGMLAYFWLLATPAMGFVWGLYFYISVCWCHIHYDEAFSSLREANCKSFVRMHIGPTGDLRLYSLALDKVPTRWQEDPRWRGPHGGGWPGVGAHEASYPSRWLPAAWGRRGGLPKRASAVRWRLVDWLHVPKRQG